MAALRAAPGISAASSGPWRAVRCAAQSSGWPLPAMPMATRAQRQAASCRCTSASGLVGRPRRTLRLLTRAHSVAGAAHHHGHHHHHDHHDHGHHHHGHGHGHEHHGVPENAVSRVLGSLGLLRLARAIDSSWVCTAASFGCFAVAMLMQLLPLAQHLPALLATHAHNAALAGTFILSGIPQVVEALCIAGGGTLDTHVLMALAVVGTLYLGMAHEVRPPPPLGHVGCGR